MNFKMFTTFATSLPPSKALYARGVHGIGKTTIAQEIADYFGLKLVTFNLSQMADVADFIGMPTKENYTDAAGVEQIRMSWAAPFWYDPTQPVMLLLDEFPRAKMEVRNAVMQLLLEHRILDKKLADGSRIMLAGNPAKMGIYDAEMLDPALVDRVAICDVEPTFEESFNYIQTHGGHSAVLAYLSKNRNDMLPYTNYSLHEVKQLGEVKLTSPRSWHEFSDWLTHAERQNGGKLPMGLVKIGTSAYLGNTVADKFWPYYNDSSNQLGAEDVLDGWNDEIAEKVKKMDTPTVTILVNNILLWCADMGDKEPTEKNRKNFKKFYNALAPEIQAAVTRDVIQKSILSGEPNSITMLTDDEMNSKFLELVALGV
jgi:hypothetical protein